MRASIKQTRRPNRQLELPMLSDINGKSSTVQKLVTGDAPDLTAPSSSSMPGASAQDLSVYDKISDNHFQSLKKA
jgi:hypothetical protein